MHDTDPKCVRRRSVLNEFYEEKKSKYLLVERLYNCVYIQCAPSMAFRCESRPVNRWEFSLLFASYRWISAGLDGKRDCCGDRCRDASRDSSRGVQTQLNSSSVPFANPRSPGRKKSWQEQRRQQTLVARF